MKGACAAHLLAGESLIEYSLCPLLSAYADDLFITITNTAAQARTDKLDSRIGPPVFTNEQKSGANSILHAMVYRRWWRVRCPALPRNEGLKGVKGHQLPPRPENR